MIGSEGTNRNRKTGFSYGFAMVVQKEVSEVQ